jgi:8-oxo-dGTP pyrophosphatase MutT (NUDIX family)
MYIPDEVFCISQKAFIEKNGKILVIHDPLEGLDFPGGKIQKNEAQHGKKDSLSRSLQREVLEETGLSITVGRPFSVWYYEFPIGHKNYPNKVYIIGFQCIYVSGVLTLSSEHTSFQWVSSEQHKHVDDGSDFFQALKEYSAEALDEVLINFPDVRLKMEVEDELNKWERRVIDKAQKKAGQKSFDEIYKEKKQERTNIRKAVGVENIGN